MSVPSWCSVDAAMEQYASPLSKGTIYTVAGIFWDDMPAWYGGHLRLEGRWLVTLAGLSNPYDGLFGAFYINRFRPLITQSDDIATHFEQHLRLSNPVREGV